MTPPKDAIRRRREREARERDILQAAQELMAEEGYLGLTMDQVAKAVGYSKPTVYEHFRTKEDLVMAVCTYSFQVRADMFEAAARRQAPPRALIHALGVADRVYWLDHPIHESTASLVMTPSILEKTSEERRNGFLDVKRRAFEHTVAIVRAGIAAQDLDADHDPREVTLALWSLSIGVQSFARGGHMLPAVGITEPAQALRRAQLRYLDGIGWAPLTEAWDYDSFEAGVERELHELFDAPA